MKAENDGIENTEINKKAIINCHTHIFTGDHVPPYLAKTFLPSPLHLLLPLSLVVKTFRWYYRGPYKWQFKSWYKTLIRFLYRTKIFINRNVILRIVFFILAIWLTIHAFFVVFDWLTRIVAPDAKGAKVITTVRICLEQRNLLFYPAAFVGRLALVLIVLLFIESGRNIILFILKKLWSFFRILPGPQTKELLLRYINIGRFSFNVEQQENYKRLRNQYPRGTGFIILPMDMEYMAAGRLKQEFRYEDQMKELAELKDNKKYTNRFFPFVFADPRRIAADPAHLKYQTKDNLVQLESCFIKEYIENKGFSGFKIYPALGYYPFDEMLLPIWKYAADNEIPILTHCIRGNIFYRGNKKEEWDYHPIFKQAVGDEEYEPLLLHQMKNIDFINNFTHPLNYLCLLEEKLLRQVVAKCNDDRIREVFGFINIETELTSNLNHLKLCFGHYGGEDEWKRFMEYDRDNFSSQLIKYPDSGIHFLTDEKGIEKKGKLEQIWKYADWYTITSSLMLQYPNVYGDLSYILHDEHIKPLLKHTMLNEKLKYKVLYGTDFYVVRNHKSEKQMLAEQLDSLSEDEFDLIARENPRNFLMNKIHGPIKI